MGCRILKNEADDPESVVYGSEIQSCTGLASGTVVPIMARLKNAGLLVSEMEEGSAAIIGRPLRKFYAIAQSERGQAFRATLQQSPDCLIDRRRKEAEDAVEDKNDDIVTIAVAARVQKMRQRSESNYALISLMVTISLLMRSQISRGDHFRHICCILSGKVYD